MRPIGSQIRGTGHYVPERVVTNAELAPIIGSTDAWIRERTGISQRHFISEGESTSSLALHAAHRALEDAKLSASKIDAIIFATLSPDTAFPGSGVYLQSALDLVGVPAIDIRAQCSGFIYGLSVADSWIRSGAYECILLVGAEVHSTGLDLSPKGKDVSAIFGDGAGAAIIEPSDVERIRNLKLGADGSGASLLMCEAPGSKRFPSLDRDAIDSRAHFPTMSGRTVFRKAVECLTGVLSDAIEASDEDVSDIVFVLHQANQRITDMVADRLGLPLSQFVCTIEHFGNTTAASIPMAIDVARKRGELKDGTTVICAAFGSGLTWGVAELVI